MFGEDFVVDVQVVGVLGLLGSVRVALALDFELKLEGGRGVAVNAVRLGFGVVPLKQPRISAEGNQAQPVRQNLS